VRAARVRREVAMVTAMVIILVVVIVAVVMEHKETYSARSHN
jgi:hypothetical protein